MKRIAYLLVVVMLLACLPLTAFAAKAGDEVTINFTAQNSGFAGYAATVNYDSTALKLVGISASGIADVNGNSVMVMSLTPITDMNLFTATFEVLDGAKAGKTYNVTATVTEAYDENVNPVSLSISGGSIKIDDCDHAWGDWTGTEATCGAAGHLTRTCSKCGEVETATPAATGLHTATYTDVDDDQHRIVCSVCGLDTLEAHSYDAGVETVKPGHLPGQKTYTCADCGGTKVEVIPATTDEHNADSVTDWTKLDDEYHQGTCECGETIKEKHNWDSGVVTVKPTEDKDGERKHTCVDCGAVKYVVEKYVDNVPNTGDITPQVTMSAAALVVMMSAVALVFKRKVAK